MLALAGDGGATVDLPVGHGSLLSTKAKIFRSFHLSFDICHLPLPGTLLNR
jgi:hypothetical protein